MTALLTSEPLISLQAKRPASKIAQSVWQDPTKLWLKLNSKLVKELKEVLVEDSDDEWNGMIIVLASCEEKHVLDY